MLIIFDVDGTLVGGESHDWACFDQAIHSVLGFEPTQAFFDSLPEITAQAIAEASVRVANRELGTGLEERLPLGPRVGHAGNHRRWSNLVASSGTPK